jgi:uncharacterized membrane protein
VQRPLSGRRARGPERKVRRVSLDLAMIRFDGQGTAVTTYAAARDRSSKPGVQRTEAQWTRDVGFVERHHNGRLLLRGTFAGHYLDVDEGDRLSQKGAGEGAATGGLLGVLAGPPGIALGLMIGAYVGTHLANAQEVEDEPEPLAERLREAVPRESSAIVMIAPAPEVDEMLTALGEGAQDIIRRTLTDGETDALEASLRLTPPSSPDV